MIDEKGDTFAGQSSVLCKVLFKFFIPTYKNFLRILKGGK